MKVLVQWTRSNPSDWEEIDSSAWESQPKRADPRGGEIIDDEQGWVFRINVQGVEFTGDHYAVDHLTPGEEVEWYDGTTRTVPAGGGCRVYCWSDDPEDYTIGYRNAKVYTFLALRPDPKFGNAYNVQQSLDYYADDVVRGLMPSSLEEGRIHTYEEFVPPSDSKTRHGIWTLSELHDKHESKRTERGWREWTEGLPDDEVVDGVLRAQRSAGKWSKAKGTKTFYCKNVALANDIHTADNEEEMVRFLTRVQETLSSQSIGGGAQGVAFCFTSYANEPNSAAWPAGTYRCQLDVSAVGADITYGLLNQTVSGHFARVNSGLTADSETKQQVESAFTGTGLKLATTGSTTWTSGNASDRFECLVSIARPANHGQQSLTLNLGDADAFADGPWTYDPTDAIAVTDTVTVEKVALPIERSASDSVSVTDSISVEMSYGRTESDTAVITDARFASLVDTITPIIATQDTTQNTTSQTYVDVACETSELEDGVEYLVIYRASTGGSDTDAKPEMQLLFGATTLAEVASEGRGLGQHWDSTQCSGFCRVTGNGTDTLKFQLRSIDALDTVYAGAMKIVAIPLTEFGTEDSDFFEDGTNSGTNEVTNAATGSWTTVRTVNFTLPETGDYLVLMAVEGQPGDSVNTTAAMVRFRGDGATLGSEFHQEWEDADDWFSFQYVGLHNFSSGSRTFAVECQSRSAAETDYRRSRIWVINKSRWDQIIETTDTTGATTTSGTFVDFTGLNTTYTPNQDEFVVVLGHTVAGCSTTNSAPLQLRNNTDGTNTNVNAGEYENDNGFDADRDQVPSLLATSEQIASAKDYRVQYRAEAGTAAVGKNPDNTAGVQSNLIVWGLTASAGAVTNRSASDTASVTDSTTAEMTFERSASDAISVTDAVAASCQKDRDVSDNVSVTDSVDAQLTLGRSASDAISVTDAVTEEATYDRTATDTISVTDTASAGIMFERDVSDTVSVSDSVSAEMFFDRTESDSITVVETFTDDTNYTRNNTDTVAVTDTIAEAGNTRFESASDSVSVTDTVEAQLTLGRSASDTISVTDSLSAEMSFDRDLSDTISVTDNIAEAVLITSAIDRSASDSISVTDTLSIEMFFDRDVAETVTVSDILAQAVADKYLFEGFEWNFDANLGVSTTGSAVDSWTDQWKGDQLTSVGGQEPTLISADSDFGGSDSVSGDGTEFMTASIGAEVSGNQKSQTWYVVMRWGTIQTFRDIVHFYNQTDSSPLQGIGSGSDVLLPGHPNWRFQKRDNGGSPAGSDQGGNGIFDASHYVVVSHSGVVASIYNNSMSQVDAFQGTLGNTTLDRMRIFTNRVGTTIATAKIARILIYSTEHTSARRLEIESLLREDYNLPEHPFLPDAVDTSDTATTQAELERSVSDTISVTDSATTEMSIAVSAGTDVISVSDAVDIEVVYGRTAADTISTADTVAAETILGGSASDTVSVTDQTSVETSFDRDLSDSITVAETLAADTQYVRDANDTVSVTDTVARTLLGGTEYLRSANDSVSVTDALTAETDYLRVSTDTVAVSDSVATEATFERSSSDSVSLSDTAAASLTIEVAATDSITATDALAADATYERTVADSLSVTDTAAEEAVFERTVADAVTVTDTATADTSVGAFVADTISVTDSTATETSYARDVADSTVVTESLTAETNYVRTAADAVSVTDSAAGAIIIDVLDRSASDSISVADALNAEAFFDRSDSDAISVTDTADRTLVSGEVTGSASDSVTVTDQVQTEADYAREENDVLIISDTVVREAVFVRSANDTVSVTDQAAATKEVSVLITDTVLVTDFVDREVSYTRIISDSVSVTDFSFSSEEVKDVVLTDLASALDAVFAIAFQAVTPPTPPRIGGSGPTLQPRRGVTTKRSPKILGGKTNS